jgi:hypothetical protein
MYVGSLGVVRDHVYVCWEFGSSEGSCICMLGVSILPLSMIFLIGF